MITGILNINYEEGNQESYESVSIGRFGIDGIKVFDSGDIFLDYASAVTWANKLGIYLLLSSSVDHFVQDGEGYQWATYNDIEVIVPIGDD